MTITKDTLVSKAGDLQVLPFVARKALDILNNVNCSIDDLNEVIEKDQTIAARILKISNSALYGMRQEVNSLHRAMMILGIKTMRSLILTASTKSLYKKFGITEKMMWDHSVGAGIASKMIAQDLGSEVEDIAFIGGLMHDLGKVIMNNETPDLFSKVMMNIYNENTDSIKAEQDVYGFDHTEIGAGVVKKWKFAPILIDIIGKHHLHNCTLETLDGELQAKSVACVNLADNICKVQGIGYRSQDDSIVLHELPSAVFLGKSKDKMDKLLADVSDTYTREKSAFD